MKRMLIIISILALNIAYSQLYDSFDIPTFSYRTAQLNGDPMISMTSEAGESVTDMSFGGSYDFSSQSPEMSYSYGSDLEYESNGATETTEWDLDVPFSVNKYFGDSHGVFGFADGNLNMFGGDAYEGVDDTKDLNLTVGAGYGRVISAKPVAQANAIAGELGGASDAAVLEMAGIISKWNSGWYHMEHKDNATVQYYNDLADASGNSGSAMKIQQITTNAVYNISDRSIGWYVQAGLSDNYMKAEGDESKGDMQIKAGYAKPIGNDKQLSAMFQYDKNMADGAGNVMTLGAGYSIDHTYTWATTAGFTYESDVAMEGADAVTTMGLSINTTKSIINQLTGTASFDYSKVGEADASTAIEARLTYYLF